MISLPQFLISVHFRKCLSVLHYIPTADKTAYVNYFRYAGHSTAASDWIYSPASRWKRCALTSVMGGALSVTNRTENRIVVQLEQNPVAIRYWGYVEPGATNKVWEHAPCPADPLNQGFFIMRVIDVNSLPSTYQPPNMFLEQCKSAGFGLLGIPGLGSTAIVTLIFLASGSPNWKSPQWAIPPGDTTQHREVWKSVHIGRNTQYDVIESKGDLLLQKTLEDASEASSTTQSEEQNQPPESSKDNSTIAEVSPSVQISVPPPGVEFWDQKVIPCTSKGVDFNFEQYDIALHVPEGAVAKGELVDIQLSVVSRARFSYPASMKIISPVIWLCTRHTKLEVFQKPVEITLAHFFDAATDDPCQKLCFLKGNHMPSVMSGGAAKRHYRLVEANGKSSFHEDYGMLSTKHFNFCFACVAVALESQDRFIYKSKYYLVAGIPKEITTPQWSVFFCVTFHLKTCLETVRKQFDSEAVKMLPPREFRFKDCEDDAKLTLAFSRSIDGWTIARECLNKEIFAKDIDFSDIDPDDLEEMETTRVYPPRFILTISGINAEKDATVAEVAFNGSRCPLSIELVLSKPGAAMSLQEVKEKPHQHIVKSQGETAEKVKTIEYHRGVEVIAETQFIVKGKHSQTFKWEGHGLNLSIPEGAVLSESVIYIKAGLVGHFELPSHAQLVSAVYWLYCENDFQRPVTLELQHCVANKHQSDFSSLHFIVAKCSQEELPYKFEYLDRGTFSQHNSYGSVDVKQFSLFGIVQTVVRWFANLLQFQTYFAQLFYFDKGENKWQVDFVITKNLELCLEYIEKKYATVAVKGPDTPLQFERESISLAIPENCVTNGWKITPLNAPEISKKLVDSYEPGKGTPCCQLRTQLCTTVSPKQLNFKLTLEGAKSPHNFLTIIRDPVAQQLKENQSDAKALCLEVYHPPSAQLSWQYQAMTRNSAAVIRALAANGLASILAEELKSRKLIGAAVYAKATSSGPDITEYSRVKHIVNAMLNKIECIPQCYHDFIAVLQLDGICEDADAALALLTTDLQQDGSDEEDGGSRNPDETCAVEIDSGEWCAS